MSIKITFPDGAVREYDKGITALDIANKLSNSLGKKILSAKINNKVCDATLPINDDATLELLTWNENDGKQTFWHSSAHLLAEALESLYTGVKFGIGPPIDNGFYYDVDFGDNVVSANDLVKIEKKMKDLAAQKSEYKRQEISKADAIQYFTEKGDEYKLELLDGLNDGEITFYTQGNFTDLCRGPHIPNTGFIKSIKLMKIAGAYWRGDEKRKQLTRIYGVTFPNQQELDDYLLMLEEAEKRDHRKLGQQLQIYTFDEEVGPGLPLWLPNGGFLIEKIEELAKKTEDEAGYSRVRTPHIAKEALYLRSGHLPYYAESMFPPMELDNVKYYLKAMNCPHHHKIFGAIPKSYKDLPIRLAEYGTCYRYEDSGSLFGLMRVRSLQMNDAHIYCTKEQFEQEFRAVNEMYLKYFKIFGIEKYKMRLSKHEPSKLGQKYINEPELWIETEKMVRDVLISSNIPFDEVPDEAAFYGPKIDIQIYSVIGREFTLATNQVDFAQGRRFNLKYVNKENQEDYPIIIHRAPLSTHERFIGFLLEHYAGNFPLWLTPKQVAILPISDKFLDFSTQIANELKANGFRITLDERAEKIGKKIRDAELMKIPYMLVIGEKEVENQQISVRKHGKGDIGTFTIQDFNLLLQKELEN
ncbi:MAG TPA: threonine--tRNA ligase [Chitinophagales bacterium]|nr:threonine--tRNA ligase [Chitinophagales bacterium]MCB0512103.1 threonine--tRNA ligase [Bacteroidota bacterium]MCB9075312.1 threonine--tRNA ligase [Chitinophagales bacterium]HMU97241.1 threonine--tRNA ligase [Chitinophagales bacterium]HMV02044.1 threonine--tRNA ligase [Chitinophagales bacterium]